ncbi:MAG TPA: aminoglycoside phosphotransferase family protein [Streptosporangiaceae bacterium]|nr:aminoglycoside phosphotransferase family protein [Streptosporangiaceae bacterium]
MPSLPGILGRVLDAAAEFSASAALSVLREACQQAGFSSDGAELLRIGENAIFQLASAPIVVRIGRSADRLPRVQRELCVARWLAAAKVPAVLVDDEIDQPLMVDGHPVSFWHAVTGGAPTPTHIDLARLLAAYHATPDCPCDLDTFEPLRISESRLAKAEGVDPGDLGFLHGRVADLTSQFEHLEFALPRGPIHGDAHTKNLLTDHGQVVLIDFEAAAIGPREWDLLPTSIAVQRYGLPEEQYQEFAAAYGFDVRTWDGYPVLREIRELTMTTWIMQNVLESKAIAAEFALRVACLRERDYERAWHFF